MAVKMSGKVYDGLKWGTLILLPATAVLYSSLSTVWMFPYTKEVVGTIAAVDVFLGTLLGISNLQYRKVLSNPVLLEDPKPIVKVAWVMSGNTYDVLMWVAQVVLPGVATFYYALATLWALPEPDKVVTTIMAIDTFLGMVIGFSSSQYNKTAQFVQVRLSQ